MNVGIVGLGTIGSALAEGLRDDPHVGAVRGTTKSAASAERASAALGVPVDRDNAALVAWADVVLLCVKPHQVAAICEAIAPASAGKLVISTCAAVLTSDLRARLAPSARVVRAMPNTPCVVRAGMTVLCGAEGTSAEDLALAERLFAPLGRTAVAEESLFDGVTGLSGCGPAYVFLIIEALAEAGVKVGLPRKTSILLAAQTLLGASTMVLERGQHPAALKDEVTTPAGCTIDGLTALEEGRLRSTLISGVVAAAERSAKLRTT
jgi:pyrroline-5-carboxylate reductase